MTPVPPGWTPEQARKRLDAATPGPWIAQSGIDRTLHPGYDVWIVTTEDDQPETWQGIAECNLDRPEANAAFIANAPQDIAALLALLDDAKEALRPYVENAAPHEQLWNGEDFRNFQRADAFLARFAAKDET